MATIGTIKLDSDGSMTGEIDALRFSARVRIIPNARCSDNSPDFRVYTGRAKLGGVWKKKSARDQSAYLAVTLDDPSFATPIYAVMFEHRDEPDTFDLVWERPTCE